MKEVKITRDGETYHVIYVHNQDAEAVRYKARADMLEAVDYFFGEG